MTNLPDKKFSISGRLRSFIYAFNGLRHTLRSQYNFRIHLVAGVMVIACGFVARLSGTEWCMLMLAMGLAISMEAMNTAVEKLVDVVSPGYEKEAGLVKDIAAGAVLITAIVAVVIGGIIFIPKVL